MGSHRTGSQGKASRGMACTGSEGQSRLGPAGNAVDGYRTDWQSWMGLARIVQTRNGSHGEAWQAEAWTGCVRSGRNESIGKG